MLQPLRAGSRAARLFTALLLAAAFTIVAPAARASSRHAARGKTAGRAKAAHHPKVTPAQEGKVVLLPIRDDDDHGFTSQIDRLLRGHGLDIATDVRGVDTSEQFRELATHLGIAAFVAGNLKEREGDAISRITIEVRSGYTGKKLTTVTFRETKLHLRAELEDKLWAKVGPAIARACADASKPRKRDRDPMMIEAGTPLADK